MLRVTAVLTITIGLLSGAIATGQVYGYAGCVDHVVKFNTQVPAITEDVTGYFAVGPGATGVAMSHDGKFAYVTNQFFTTVGKYDTGRPGIEDWIIVGNGPVGIDVMPGNKQLLVALAPSNELVLVDIATRSVVQSIPLSGSVPVIVKIEPRGHFAYIGYEFETKISVIDLATLTEVRSIPTGWGSVGIAFTPAGDKAYVSGAFSNTVTVVDTATSSVISTLTGLDGPEGLAVTPDGKELWISNHGSAALPPLSAKISVYSTVTDTLIDVMDFPQYVQRPHWMAFTPDGKWAWITMESPPEVRVGTGDYSIAIYSVTTHGPQMDLTVPPFGCSGIAIANPNPLQNLVTNLTALVNDLNLIPQLKSLLVSYLNQIPTRAASLSTRQKTILIRQLTQMTLVIKNLIAVHFIAPNIGAELESYLEQIITVLAS